MAYKILIVDDEPDIIDIVGYNLKKEGYEVFSANSGIEAIEIAEEVRPHLIILDVMMPQMDGMECCEILRSKDIFNNTIITFLSARAEDYSQIAGFEAGADDYIAKPVKPKVLISRVKALLKRYHDSSEVKQEENTSIQIDREAYVVILEDKSKLQLPRKEFELLSLLMSHPGRVFSRDEIFSSLWGDDVIVGERTMDVHVRKLREKVGDHHIVTIKGVGYKFE